MFLSKIPCYLLMYAAILLLLQMCSIWSILIFIVRQVLVIYIYCFRLLSQAFWVFAVQDRILRNAWYVKLYLDNCITNNYNIIKVQKRFLFENIF